MNEFTDFLTFSVSGELPTDRYKKTPRSLTRLSVSHFLFNTMSYRSLVQATLSKLDTGNSVLFHIEADIDIERPTRRT